MTRAKRGRAEETPPPSFSRKEVVNLPKSMGGWMDEHRHRYERWSSWCKDCGWIDIERKP